MVSQGGIHSIEYEGKIGAGVLFVRNQYDGLCWSRGGIVFRPTWINMRSGWYLCGKSIILWGSGRYSRVIRWICVSQR